MSVCLLERSRVFHQIILEITHSCKITFFEVDHSETTPPRVLYYYTICYWLIITKTAGAILFLAISMGSTFSNFHSNFEVVAAGGIMNYLVKQ